jgi:hypothetical protein
MTGNKFKDILIIIFIGFFIFTVAYWTYLKIGHNHLDENGKCTTCTLIGWQYVKSRRVLEFCYHVNGKYYKSTTSYDRNWQFSFGDKFWGKYLSSDPNIADLIEDEKGVFIKVVDPLVT